MHVDVLIMRDNADVKDTRVWSVELFLWTADDTFTRANAK